MPIFYANEMDIKIKDNDIEKSMIICDSGKNSELADFGSNELTNEFIDNIFNSLTKKDK